MLAEARNAPAGDDRMQIEASAQLLARVIEAPSEPQVPITGMHEHIDAVERIPFRIMGGEIAVADNIQVGVQIAPVGVLDDQRQRCGDDLALVFNADLTFREMGQL